MADNRTRCAWAGDDPLMIAYHDGEWGTPQHDDRALFELLTLEGAQAGLSWTTILRKREGYRRAFGHFDPERVARYGERDIERLLSDASIVRNRAKIVSTVDNARAVAEVKREFGSFDGYVWSFTGGKQLHEGRRTLGDIPSETPVSREMSRDMKRRGFRFVGPTTVYSFMQGAGVVDDHVDGCFRAKRR